MTSSKSLSPQQRAAQTRMDRAQLAAIVADVDDMRGDVDDMRGIVSRLLGVIENMIEASRLLREEIQEDSRSKRPGAPELQLIVNEGTPRPSRRRPPQLRLASPAPR